MNFLSNDDMNQVLDRCIDSESHLVITRKNNEDWQIYKSHVKSGSSTDDITIEEQQLTYGQEGDPSGEVGVSFRQGHHKLLFRTTLQDNTLAWPTQLTKISRRAYQRQFPQDSITVRLKRAEIREHYSILEDISIGGMEVSSIMPDYKIGPYSCTIYHSSSSITVNAILRQVKPGKNNVLFFYGFQFMGLEFDPQTATQLARLTNLIARQTKKSQSSVVLLPSLD